jgi:hypothetical protein
VVLPFTNIIEQSVATYRKALVLPGENPADVVAELHHRADFESADARHLTALWRSPIIVTTAVAFFETLASNTPAALRRLHELPGSAIFVDESHAAMPAKLLPIAWKWIDVFAEDWGCYWVLASGSLCRFWQIEEIAQSTDIQRVPEVVDEHLRKRLGAYECNRITYQSDLIPKSQEELLDWTCNFPGPRLIILNTVQNAAVIASTFNSRFGREYIEHLSTALNPIDRKNTLKRVKERLSNPHDNDWTLVATSCVEAGVDISFRTGFRELGTLVSLLQTSGRVNRGGEYGVADIWTFILKKDGRFTDNPSLQNAAKVLQRYFTNNTQITPDLSTKAICEELKLRGLSKIYNELIKSEAIFDFPSVAKEFKIITDDRRTAVTDIKFVELLRSGRVNWRDLQQNSVQIPYHILVKKHRKSPIIDDIYFWDLGYDDLLGYMAGVLSPNNLKFLNA